MSFPSRKLILFALLSVADFFLTWHLLLSTGGTVYESNPVARRLLDGYGWAGLAAFKAACVLLAVGACLAVGRLRPRVAGRTLTFGCAALAGVVLYSGWLAAGVHARRAAEDAAQAQDAREAREVERQVREIAEYRGLLDRLCGELAARRRTLAEAVRELEQTTRGSSPDWLARLRATYGRDSARECLAADLIRQTVLSLEAAPDAAREVARALEAAFLAEYGRRPPRSYDQRPRVPATEPDPAGPLF